MHPCLLEQVVASNVVRVSVGADYDLNILDAQALIVQQRPEVLSIPGRHSVHYDVGAIPAADQRAGAVSPHGGLVSIFFVGVSFLKNDYMIPLSMIKSCHLNC